MPGGGACACVQAECNVRAHTALFDLCTHTHASSPPVHNRCTPASCA
jgi:hypothetical protein